MQIKIHRSYRTVVSVCDSNLVGKRFEEGKMQLDIRENFYKGEEKSYEETVKIIKFQSREDATFNIVGKESIRAALEAGIIEKKGIAYISKIPFALVLI